MGQFDLKASLIGGRTLPEDFQDQPGSVDHLGFGRLLKIALLNRAQRVVDNHQFGIFHPRKRCDLVDLTTSEQSCGFPIPHAKRLRRAHVYADSQSEAFRLLETGVTITPFDAVSFSAHDHGPRATRYFVGRVPVEDGHKRLTHQAPTRLIRRRAVPK